MSRAISACLFAILCLPALAVEQATIKGSVAISDGSSAEGVEVVFKDLVTGQEFTAPTNAAGEYTLDVPQSARYQMVRAMGPDGLVIDIQNSAPLAVSGPGPYGHPPLRIKVVDAPDLDTPGPVTEPPEAHTPWYRRKGPVLGVVLGGAAVALVLVNDDDDDSNTPVSP
jgi:hypothetical protein